MIFRCELHIASKCGYLSEPEGRVGTGAFTDQAYAVSRKYHESLHENVYYVAGSIMEQAPAFQ